MTGDLTRVARDFDAWAPTYDEHPWYRAQGRQVLQRLREDPPGSLLDVGCGTGRLLRRAASAQPGLRGIGVDLSPGMIARARELAGSRGLDSLEFRHGDWEAMETSFGEPLEAAVCVSALHYFARPVEALRRMRNALVDGGRILVLDREMQGSLLTRAWDLAHRYVVRDHVRFYTSTQIGDMLAAAGFEDCAVVERTRGLFWSGKLYTSLVLIEARAAGVAGCDAGSREAERVTTS
ncbi:MAG: class I SAM-dependent methyltransferase [bacterium]|nr:class I SAM-dependent methyltransferase [bacterium]